MVRGSDFVVRIMMRINRLVFLRSCRRHVVSVTRHYAIKQRDNDDIMTTTFYLSDHLFIKTSTLRMMLQRRQSCSWIAWDKRHITNNQHCLLSVGERLTVFSLHHCARRPQFNVSLLQQCTNCAQPNVLGTVLLILRSMLLI